MRPAAWWQAQRTAVIRKILPPLLWDFQISRVDTKVSSNHRSLVRSSFCGPSLLIQNRLACSGWASNESLWMGEWTFESLCLSAAGNILQLTETCLAFAFPLATEASLVQCSFVTKAWCLEQGILLPCMAEGGSFKLSMSWFHQGSWWEVPESFSTKHCCWHLDVFPTSTYGI